MIHPEWTRPIITIDTLIRKAGYENELYELDFALWDLLRSLTQHDPVAAISSFGLSAATASNLASASDEELNKLSSGLVLSFGLKTSEQSVLEGLDNAPRTPSYYENLSILYLNYWMLLNRVAAHDSVSAAQYFGVSQTLADAIAVASSTQIRHLVATVPTLIKLRFDPALIDSMLHGCGLERSIASVKKIQQSIVIE